VENGKRSLQEITAYVKATRQDGRPFPKTPSTGKRSPGSSSTWNREKGGLRLAGDATEMMGLYGQFEVWENAPFGGMMCHGYQFAPGNNIAAGSGEVLCNVIAWTGLGLP